MVSSRQRSEIGRDVIRNKCRKINRCYHYGRYFETCKGLFEKRHLDLLPHGNNNILENLDFIYDENWENQGVPYPYEILTYLFDSYYVLPERPDLAALFCW